jgi:ribosome-associated protein
LETIQLREDYIKLGQALKAAGLVSSGIDAKIVITNAEVTVNGEVEERRGRKLYDSDVVEFDGHQVKIVK